MHRMNKRPIRPLLRTNKYWMKRIGQVFSVISLILVSAACGLENGALPTLVPRVNLGSGQESGGNPDDEPAIDESPRTGLEIEVPATWTPEPENELLKPIDQLTPSAVNESQLDASPARTYIVQQGDTLAEIAIQFEVTLEELARLNNITDINHIEAGQELTIPGS